MKGPQKLDRADAVVRVASPDTDDMEAVIAAANRAHDQAIKMLRKLELSRNLELDEIAYLDAAGNPIFSFSPTSGPQQFFLDEKKTDDSAFPNFQYLVGTGPGEQRIVIRIEWEHATLH